MRFRMLTQKAWRRPAVGTGSHCHRGDLRKTCVFVFLWQVTGTFITTRSLQFMFMWTVHCECELLVFHVTTPHLLIAKETVWIIENGDEMIWDDCRSMNQISMIESASVFMLSQLQPLCGTVGLESCFPAGWWPRWSPRRWSPRRSQMTASEARKIVFSDSAESFRSLCGPDLDLGPWCPNFGNPSKNAKNVKET